MPFVTSLILAAFVGYAGSWYMGLVEGNFALLLMLATAVTGLYWFAERFYFLPQRQKAALALETSQALRHAELKKQGIEQIDNNIQQARARLLMQPWWLDWTAGLFPVIITVFILRSFLFEPFKIPSGSMIPTLWVGDLILVNKFTYGLRLPVFNTKVTQGTAPQRGDVMVFRYPPNPNLDYIKRVVGVPGDTINYVNKRLTVNGQAVETQAIPEFYDETERTYFKQFEETFGSQKHRTIQYENRRAGFMEEEIGDFPSRKNCSYNPEGFTCKVPEGAYFMMGDNRDNSQDSRYWGFVPERNIVGKAFFVWMNFSNLKRIGAFN